MKMLLVMITFILMGCATQGVDRASQNKIIKEFYASVESRDQVELSSEVKTGIVGGAAVGVIDNLDGNHEDMIAGALAGALVGGIFTAMFEGSNTAYEYSLHSADQGDFSVIQKDKFDLQSNCVKVRVAAEVVVSPASTEKCQFN
ncbi:hypothetical protein [Colwellia psychrerythraea]|uniref:Glycine zipper 2TM domain-containing protein n=1 Tax=Colwellia psychrerythraea TaxID=28229 RepID=A0A099KSY7_COLPS|nr:hypothetical protein [Colwellia psychrerythraea]KGJ93325.1 hypothetical protein GAB14E_2649 [Colwellia psychrerythraea]